MRKGIAAVPGFTFDFSASLMRKLLEGNPELFRHQVANGPANIKQKAIGDFAIIGNAAREGWEVRSQVVASVLFEFVGERPRPLGLLAAYIRAQFVAIDVQIFENMRSSSATSASTGVAACRYGFQYRRGPTCQPRSRVWRRWKTREFVDPATCTRTAGWSNGRAVLSTSSVRPRPRDDVRSTTSFNGNPRRHPAGILLQERLDPGADNPRRRGSLI